MTKQDVVQLLACGRSCEPAESGTAFAPANIALCKYWGKRNEELNLPITSSLSISLGRLGSEVEISCVEGMDHVELNGDVLPHDAPFAARLFEFLDLFRMGKKHGYRVIARNTIPTAAGFASSASGFAALVTALDQLYNWNLEKKELSILARLGSGSACRSVYHGFVEWDAGAQDDGMDSFARPIHDEWPELCLGLVIISSAQKKTGSRPGMRHTVETSPLYSAWPDKVAADLPTVREAIQKRDFALLGATAESNALCMHATMASAQPALLYWQPESVAAMHTVWALREEGLPLYFTMDAGPNLKLLFEAEHQQAVSDAFPGLQIVAPFSRITGDKEPE